jgi:glycerol uptake facilitator-like aquaporin
MEGDPLRRGVDEPVGAFTLIFIGAGAAIAANGPQLVGDRWSHAWVWCAGPILGAAVAVAVYEYLYLRPSRPEPVGSSDSGVIEPRAGEPA